MIEQKILKLEKGIERKQKIKQIYEGIFKN